MSALGFLQLIVIFAQLLLFPVHCAAPGGNNISSNVGAVKKQKAGLFDHTLHVVIIKPARVVDEKNQGFARVFMDGAVSHTHQPGARLVSFKWTANGKQVSTQQSFFYTLRTAKQTLCLTITDNFGQKLTDCETIVLQKANNLKGTELFYFKNKKNFGEVGGQPSQTEFRNSYGIQGLPAVSPPFVVRFQGRINFPKATTVKMSKNVPARLLVGGKLVTLPYTFQKGLKPIDLRVVVSNFNTLPFSMVLGGGGAIPNAWLSFDQTKITSGAITINSITPKSGGKGGGTKVTLKTNRFNAAGAVVVIGGKVVNNAQFSTSGTVTFNTPAGTGVKDVFIRKGSQTSNKVKFQYASQQVKFATKKLASGPYVVVEYCYNFLFTAEYTNGKSSGLVKQWRITDNYGLTLVKSITAVQKQAPQGATAVLGLVCDPFMSETNFNVYVHHSKLFQTGLYTKFPIFGDFVSYKGYVSKISSKNGFNTLQPVISGLPVSNLDHGVNGGAFLPSGELLIAIGGMTNAGYPGVKMGGLPESPYSGAILRAKVRGAGFPTKISYQWIPGQKPKYIPGNASPANAIYGDAVKPKPNPVGFYARGMRNPYDCAVTMFNKVVCTDNGANPGGFGVQQTGCKVVNGVLDYVKGPDLNGKAPNEVMIMKAGGYYGHPNMARVRAKGKCDAEGKWTPGNKAGAGVGSPSSTYPASTDGIVEYVSNVFNGQLRGSLYACMFKKALVQMNSNAKQVSQDSQNPCLDVTVGPGGAIYTADFQKGNALRVKYPVGGSGAFDVFPYRGKGGIQFFVSGNGFTAGATSVKFGGKQAIGVRFVSPRRLVGKVPFGVNGVVTVTVSNAGRSWTLPNAFRGL